MYERKKKNIKRAVAVITTVISGGKYVIYPPG